MSWKVLNPLAREEKGLKENPSVEEGGREKEEEEVGETTQRH